MGRDVVNLVLGYLNGSLSLSGINGTYLVLIPKVKDPKVVTEFRPISLCNVLYKLVSKTLLTDCKVSWVI